MQFMAQLCVLTGGPSSGKTTLLHALRDRGYLVAGESARELLKEMRCAPSGFDALLAFQNRIYALQYEKEAEMMFVDSPWPCFLDRSLIDDIAYRRYYFDSSLKKSVLLEARYRRIFFLERLEFENDGVRLESATSSPAALEHHLWRSYIEHGYELIRVPAAPLPQRVALVLSAL